MRSVICRCGCDLLVVDDLETAVVRLVARHRHRVAPLDHAGARLQALSPLATLGRGYAIVRAEGVAVREASAVAPGERLEIELSVGALGARVEDVHA